MAKRSKRQQSVSSDQESSPSNNLPTRGPKAMPALDMVILGLAGIGILLTMYLTYVAWFEAHQAFCSEGSGCDLVQEPAVLCAKRCSSFSAQAHVRATCTFSTRFVPLFLI